MGQPCLLFPNTPYLSTATATATDAYSGTSAANVLEGTEDTYWRPANTTGTKVLIIDLAEPRILDSVGLLGEGLDGVTVEIRGSSDAFVSSDVQLSAGAPLVSDVNAAFRFFDSVTYRYLALKFSTFGSAFRLAWVCGCDRAVLPYFEEDWDPDALDVEATDLISVQGLYLGSHQERAMGMHPMQFGQVMEAEYAIIKVWRDQCVRRRSPFFLIPDVEGEECYFGLTKEKDFKAPLKAGGVREVGTLTLMTRAL